MMCGGRTDFPKNMEYGRIFPLAKPSKLCETVLLSVLIKALNNSMVSHSATYYYFAINYWKCTDVVEHSHSFRD